jgi:hypothetical protein
MAPGMHGIAFRYGGVTFWRRRLREMWGCSGCGLMITITTSGSSALTEYVEYLRKYHTGHMTDAAMMHRPGELKKHSEAGTGPLTDLPLFYPVKIKFDFTQWQIQRAYIAHQQRGGKR